jgi:hypothetical protein
MAIQKQGDLLINGKPIAYEGKVKIQDGSEKRNFHPQVNGSIIITSDVSTNIGMVIVPVRATDENKALFTSFHDNGDNNTISFRDQNFSNCAMEEKPLTEDLEIVEYVFKGNPAI